MYTSSTFSRLLPNLSDFGIIQRNRNPFSKIRTCITKLPLHPRMCSTTSQAFSPSWTSIIPLQISSTVRSSAAASSVFRTCGCSGQSSRFFFKNSGPFPPQTNSHQIFGSHSPCGDVTRVLRGVYVLPSSPMGSFAYLGYPMSGINWQGCCGGQPVEHGHRISEEEDPIEWQPVGQTDLHCQHNAHHCCHQFQLPYVFQLPQSSQFDLEGNQPCLVRFLWWYGILRDPIGCCSLRHPTSILEEDQPPLLIAKIPGKPNLRDLLLVITIQIHLFGQNLRHLLIPPFLVDVGHSTTLALFGTVRLGAARGCTTVALLLQFVSVISPKGSWNWPTYAFPPPPFLGPKFFAYCPLILHNLVHNIPRNHGANSHFLQNNVVR